MKGAFEMPSLTLPDTAPLLPWYRANARDLPWRKTKDPYRIWVSEIMLQQTRVEAVIPYYQNFLDTLPDVAALAAAPEPLLLKLWEGLGYYSRVRNMQKAARTVVEKHGGVFPRDFADIRALCGIGDYTAGAVASFAFGLPYPAVDGNVLRVAARLTAFGEDILAPASKKILTTAVAAAQPRNDPATFNQAMIELGALVCTPGTPHCENCPLAAVCAARAAGKESALPLRKKPSARKLCPRTVLILRENDRVALCRRPDTGLLAGLFEPFCPAEYLATPDEVRAYLAARGITPLRIVPLGTAKHVFTHLEWHMIGFEVDLAPDSAGLLPDSAFFVPSAELDSRYALPSAYRAYRAFM